MKAACSEGSVAHTSMHQSGSFGSNGINPVDRYRNLQKEEADTYMRVAHIDSPYMNVFTFYSKYPQTHKSGDPGRLRRNYDLLIIYGAMRGEEKPGMDCCCIEVKSERQVEGRNDRLKLFFPA